MKLVEINENQIEVAMEIIDGAKAHLKEQGIDQWQNGYPDYNCILEDAKKGRGYFIMDNDDILGYICIDFEGEPAYDTLRGEWLSDEKYMVGHRLAMSEKARGKSLTGEIFRLMEELAKSKGIYYFKVDTDADNTKMQHVFKKVGFTYRGTIWFDNSEKIAFDKKII